MDPRGASVLTDFVLDASATIILVMDDEPEEPVMPIVSALRDGDAVVPAERFETLRRELGDGFIGVEIDSSPSNPWGIPKNAHSVLTEHLVDEPGHPTHDALNQVLEFFRSRLLPG